MHNYIFIISQLWLTSHPRSTVVLLDTGTPGTSREIYSEDTHYVRSLARLADGFLDLGRLGLVLEPLIQGIDDGTRTRNLYIDTNSSIDFEKLPLIKN